MNPGERPILLAIRNVAWETPHRILDSCGELEVRDVCPLEGDPLPAHDEIAGGLAPGAKVLHWHGDVFELPDGATHLAAST
jgi:hypothetical protein